MNVLSLFDGMSCGQIALNRECTYYASEIDKAAIEVTQKNFPNTIQLGDVRNWREWELPEIDILLAGSPCTGFSIAGKGLNFDDPQSKLFFEFFEILQAVKPKYFLLENVRMKKEYELLISGMLNVEPILIDSADFSAQSRKRLYWTNIPVDEWGTCDKVVEDILEDEVDEKFIIDPQRAVQILENEVSKRKIAFIGSDSAGNRIYSIHGKSVTLMGQAGGLGAKTGLYALPCLTPDRGEKRQNGRRFKPPRSKFYTLTAMDWHGIMTNHFIRKLAPTECERLQTVPEGYTSCVADNKRIKMLGNGWTVDVIRHILTNV
jgi:DNA (cytosine-5)-methyltransferase 3A